MEKSPRAIALALILMLGQPSVSLASEISQEDFDYFKEESYSQYGGDLDPADIEGQFYEIASRVSGVERAIAKFAKDLDAPVETAQEYVAALIEAVRFREACSEYRDSSSCSFQAGFPLYDAMLDSGFDDESGRLAVSIGKAIPNYTDEQRIALATYIGIVNRHPARVIILSRLYDYGRETIYAAALAVMEPTNVESAVLFRDQSQRFSACKADQYGWFLALLEMSRYKVDADEDRTTYLLFTESIVWARLRIGLISAATREFESLADELRDHLKAAPPSIVQSADRPRFIRQNTNFLLDVAYAMYSLGDSEGATELLADRDALLEGNNLDGKSDTASAGALREAMSRELSDDDLFDMYIHGRLESNSPLSGEATAGRFDDDDRWLFALDSRPAVAQSVIAKRLRDAGYDGMADYLSDDTLRRCYDDRNPLSVIEPLLPSEFFDLKDQWTERIEQVWQRAMPEPKQRGLGETIVVSRGPHPLNIEEFHLPPEFVRSKKAESDGEEDYDEYLEEESLVPEGEYVPVDPASVVRFSEQDGERHIIFLSSAIDRPGEIPAYGFWYQYTYDSGKNWGDPLYLGLQQFFPYVVVSDSRLPLRADGKLQIEVEVREIDPASITFPPIGIALKREERDIYISIDLQDLRRDSDEDFMTDVVEHRLGLNPDNPDTDGDEIFDGLDSLPLTAYDRNAPQEETDLAFAILKTIHGYERAALMVGPSDHTVDDDVLGGLELPSSRISDASTLYLVADPTLFSGVRLEDRLLVYTKDDIDLISDGRAPFYPARVSHIFRKKNRKEFYVIWSASWTGGAFNVRCREDHCTVEETSRWIT